MYINFALSYLHLNLFAILLYFRIKTTTNKKKQKNKSLLGLQEFAGFTRVGQENTRVSTDLQ